MLLPSNLAGNRPQCLPSGRRFLRFRPRPLASHQIGRLSHPVVAMRSTLDAGLLLDLGDILFRESLDLPIVPNAGGVQLLLDRRANARDQLEIIGLPDRLLERLELLRVDALRLGGLDRGDGIRRDNGMVMVTRGRGRLRLRFGARLLFRLLDLRLRGLFRFCGRGWRRLGLGRPFLRRGSRSLRLCSRPGLAPSVRISVILTIVRS